jgi:hypothetical protein
MNAMVFLLAGIIGIGVETAEQLVHEILFRDLRDRKAVGAPHRDNGPEGRAEDRREPGDREPGRHDGERQRGQEGAAGERAATISVRDRPRILAV